MGNKKNSDNNRGRDKFAEPDSPLSPPPIPAWKQGLQDIRRNGDRAARVRQKWGEFDLYLFPDPGMLWPKFYKNWLGLRAAWLWRACQCEAGCRPLFPTMWRECLFYSLATGKPSVRPGSKEFNKIWKMVGAFGCKMDESGNLVVTGAKEYPLSQASPVLQWRGNRVVSCINVCLLPGLTFIQLILSASGERPSCAYEQPNAHTPTALW